MAQGPQDEGDRPVPADPEDHRHRLLHPRAVHARPWLEQGGDRRAAGQGEERAQGFIVPYVPSGSLRVWAEALIDSGRVPPFLFSFFFFFPCCFVLGFFATLPLLRDT